MTGPTHVAIAVAGALAVSTATGNTPDALGWTAVVIGGLAPDIDAGGATIARPGSLFGRLLPRWLVWLLDQLGLLASRVIRAALGHRNATHWPVWGVLLALAGYNLGWTWLIWFGFGWLMHIAGDFCTKSGVPLLGPIVTSDIKWSPLKTGTWPEWALSFALWSYIFSYGWPYVPAGAKNFIIQFGQSFF